MLWLELLLLPTVFAFEMACILSISALLAALMVSLGLPLGWNPVLIEVDVEVEIMVGMGMVAVVLSTMVGNNLRDALASGGEPLSLTTPLSFASACCLAVLWVSASNWACWE